MRTISLLILIVMATGIVHADMGYVDSYYRRDGTYVSGHWKDTSGDGSPYNNRRYILGY